MALRVPPQSGAALVGVGSGVGGDEGAAAAGEAGALMGEGGDVLGGHGVGALAEMLGAGAHHAGEAGAAGSLDVVDDGAERGGRVVVMVCLLQIGSGAWRFLAPT